MRVIQNRIWSINAESSNYSSHPLGVKDGAMMLVIAFRALNRPAVDLQAVDMGVDGSQPHTIS